MQSDQELEKQLDQKFEKQSQQKLLDQLDDDIRSTESLGSTEKIKYFNTKLQNILSRLPELERRNTDNKILNQRKPFIEKLAKIRLRRSYHIVILDKQEICNLLLLPCPGSMIINRKIFKFKDRSNLLILQK